MWCAAQNKLLRIWDVIGWHLLWKRQALRTTCWSHIVSSSMILKGAVEGGCPWFFQWGSFRVCSVCTNTTLISLSEFPWLDSAFCREMGSTKWTNKNIEWILGSDTPTTKWIWKNNMDEISKLHVLQNMVSQTNSKIETGTTWSIMPVHFFAGLLKLCLVKWMWYSRAWRPRNKMFFEFIIKFIEKCSWVARLPRNWLMSLCGFAWNYLVSFWMQVLDFHLLKSSCNLSKMQVPCQE